MLRNLRLSHSFAFIATIASMAACGGGGGDGPTPPPPPVVVASVTVTPDAASLAPQQTVQLAATPKDASGNTLSRSVTWASNAEAVATVSTTGLVTAVAPGTAQITATSEGRSGTATITVAIPVATVTLAPTAATLVPTQTVQLTATLKDAGGATLTGRTVTWSTSAASIATVSTTGLVTAVARGTATITATSEGKNATAAITVNDGGVVSTTGGTIVAAGGNVRIAVPAGAAAAGTALTVAAESQPPTAPNTHWIVGGSTYKLGPDGTQFASPVTVTLKYDKTKIPPWVIPGDLVLRRWNGTAWNTLTNLVVDTAAGTVTGQTTGFSTFGVYMGVPTVALTPSPGQINYQRRSVDFTAHVSHHPPTNFQYRWTTSGTNGSLGAAFNNTQQYIGSTPILPDGTIDLVGVEVSAQAVAGGPFQVIGQASVPVNTDLGLTIDLSPLSQQVNFGQTVNVQTVVRDRNGSPYQGELHYEWTATQNAGTTTPAAGQRTQNPRGTYQAWPPNQHVKRPPRGDKITVKVLVKRLQWNGTAFQHSHTIVYDPLGTADAFVEIGKDIYVGRFAVETVPTGSPTAPDAACVYASVYALKPLPPYTASRYDLMATGFSDPGGLGNSYSKSWTGPVGPGTNIGDVADMGSEWRIRMDGGCATTASAVAFRQNLYATRFANIVVEVKVTP